MLTTRKKGISIDNLKTDFCECVQALTLPISTATCEHSFFFYYTQNKNISIWDQECFMKDLIILL